MEPHLLVITGTDKGIKYFIKKTKTTIGRKDCDINIEDPNVSSLHCEVIFLEKKLSLRDLGSTNGTFINNNKIEAAALRNADIILIGATKFKIENPFDSQQNGEKISDPKFLEINNLIEDELEKTTMPKIKDGFKSEYTLAVTYGANQGKIFKLAKKLTIIGRVNCDITINDIDISRKHAALEISEDNEIEIKDLESSNGTFVNNKKISSITLKPNDTILMGTTIFKLHKNN